MCFFKVEFRGGSRSRNDPRWNPLNHGKESYATDAADGMLEDAIRTAAVILTDFTTPSWFFDAMERNPAQPVLNALPYPGHLG